LALRCIFAGEDRGLNTELQAGRRAMLHCKIILTLIVQCTYWAGVGGMSFAPADGPISAACAAQPKVFHMAFNIEEFQKFSKDQIESATTAASTLSKGVQEIAAEAAEYSKKSLEDSTALVEKLLGAKTLDTAIQLQSDYAKSAYETFVSKATKFGELYTSLAKEAFKPMEAAIAKVSAPK
jgi:phasin family protein